MVTTLGTLVAGLSPFLTMAGLLALAAWRDRRRAATVAYQIRLTDAIAAQLGGIVAPVVTKPLGRRWRVVMRLPAGDPALAGRILAIAHETLGRLGSGPWEVVLVPQPASVRPLDGRDHASRWARAA
jgi:hypothetical protein